MGGLIWDNCHVEQATGLNEKLDCMAGMELGFYLGPNMSAMSNCIVAGTRRYIYNVCCLG